ncbi:MAG: DUF4400 domain-containing protein, partial [Proteobacteria bacterium]|nr:DUF4400 domain-containing protein [Pseudomonadota bacterium]
LKSRIDTLEATAYVVTYRYSIILAWYPAMMAIYIMVLFDSYLVRARSMWQFTFKSPIAHRMMTSMFMFSIIYLMLIHPFLPFAISPFYAPLAIVFQAFSLWGWISYTQKRL